ncbi:MAG: hypothetical protein Q8L10_02920 [Candidatus Moranbacteria bacterium]|nr:hypothetical protein [Candidatus Moranbacteria bacterium]
MKELYLRLNSRQQEDGSFLDAAGSPSILHTALILSALEKSGQDPLIEKIRDKAARFLLSRKDADWKFSPETGLNFFALAALAAYDKNLLDGEAMAKILIDLTSLESQEGGPYFSRAEDRSIDLATNAGIANFLSEEGVELPELTKLFENAIRTKNFKSSFFTSDYPAIYLISKICPEGRKQEFINFILEKNNRERGVASLLETVLALNALLNLGHQGEEAQDILNYLENSTERLDSTYPFYVDGNGLPVDSTADLNGALYLEALRKKESPSRQNQNGPVADLDGPEKEMLESILATAEKRFAHLPAEVQKLAGREIRKTISGNRDNQMSLMAYYMKKSLGEKAAGIPDSLVAEMGLANVFFWTAFIIYDDFWDEDEAADTAVLPVANLYARSYVDFFNFVLPAETGFNEFFHGLMDGSDAANTWENLHCRTKVEGSKFFIPKNLPDYGDYDLKYRPASGQILGPVAMLVRLGYGLESPEVTNLVAYFKNYLIAMQLNDDAHDWEEDMKRGHLSTVVTLLLKDLDWPEDSIDLETDLEELRKVFWFKTIGKAAQAAASYAEKSRQALAAITILENAAPLEKIINATESVARKALKEQADTVSFLQTYH